MAIDTILYIDDSKVLQQKYSHVLQDAGYEVLIASDGQTGIATAESAHPSLIILDMLMPGLDGVEVLRRLKRTASTSNIPVLVLSGLSQKNGDKLILEGACDYCEKGSLTPEILESAVTKALAQRWTVRAAGKP